MKKILPILFFVLFFLSCSNIQEAKRIGNLFYTYRKNNELNKLSQLIDWDKSNSNGKQWGYALHKIDSLYGKILSFSPTDVEAKTITASDNQKLIGEYVVAITYKVKYEKATVKERLTLVQEFDYNEGVQTFRIVAFESGLQAQSLND